MNGTLAASASGTLGSDRSLVGGHDYLSVNFGAFLTAPLTSMVVSI